MFQRLKEHPAYPFVAPFALFMLFLALESIHPSVVYLIYPIKTLAVGLLILLLLSRLPSFDFKQPLLALSTGLVVFVLWVGLGPSLALGKVEGGFNPFLFEDKQIGWGLAVFRILGASLVVPVMEELFWRGFLMRYLIQENFETIPLGRYSHMSFWITTALFASVHGPFAPIAFLTGIIYGALFVSTKSLGSVVLAHGMTNLLLGVYVLYTGKWTFW
jgi:CAAX prenyl protease-like protein